MIKQSFFMEFHQESVWLIVNIKSVNKYRLRKIKKSVISMEEYLISNNSDNKNNNHVCLLC